MTPPAPASGPDAAPGQDWPSPAMAWYGVIVLMMAALVAILDRQILSLLVEPIRASLMLTDVQIGILQGAAFVVFYTLLGFPVGWLMDRTHRLRLVAAGIVVWSLGTLCCGLAGSYEAMFAARALVGAGEAVVSPAAVSLIADYFAPSRRSVAMSVHGTAAMFGTGLSLVAGGALMAAARTMEPVVISGLPAIESWRFVFVACALPGIAVAALVFTAREPARRNDRPNATLTRFGPFLAIGRGWMATHFAAVCLIAVVAFAFMNWAPAFLIRRHGWSAEDVGYVIGMMFLVLGPLGILTGGLATQALQRRGVPDAALRVLRISALCMTSIIATLGLPWGATTVLVPAGLAVFCISLTPTVSVIAMQQATPNHLRGRMAAVYFITTNLVGSSLGPVATAALTQYVFEDPRDLGLSLASLALVGGPLIALLLSLSLAPYRRLLAAQERTAGTGTALRESRAGAA
jgi:MFS family permease